MSDRINVRFDFNEIYKIIDNRLAGNPVAGLIKNILKTVYDGKEFAVENGEEAKVLSTILGVKTYIETEFKEDENENYDEGNDNESEENDEEKWDDEEENDEEKWDDEEWDDEDDSYNDEDVEETDEKETEEEDEENVEKEEIRNLFDDVISGLKAIKEKILG